jgi:hypothetical protein
MINRNQFSDKNIKSIYGLGFIGEGIHKAAPTQIYQIWRHIFRRCYGNELKFSSWKDCSIIEEWHNFQNFAEWYKNNYIDGFSLDKDILIQNNRIYGPNTCCFVPDQINQLFRKNDNLKYPQGIKFDSRRNTYNVYFTYFGKNKHFGTFLNMESAYNHFKIVKKEYIIEIAELWKKEIKEDVYLAMINYKFEEYKNLNLINK